MDCLNSKNVILRKQKNKRRKKESNIVKPLSVDVIMFNLTNQKRKSLDEFYKFIQESSIENNECS